MYERTTGTASGAPRKTSSTYKKLANALDGFAYTLKQTRGEETQDRARTSTREIRKNTELE